MGVGVALTAATVWRLRGLRVPSPNRWKQALKGVISLPALVVIVVLFAGAARFLEIRDLVFPLWVDSVFHARITQLFLQQGGVPTTYRPLMPIDRFVYHFGFHSLAATVVWVTGLNVPRTLLGLGQVLNTLLLLPVYLLSCRLTKSRLAGLLSVLLVGLISLMPAYYVSWGRYTQLTGLALLPVAMVSTIDWLAERRAGWRNLTLAVVSVSGLVLVHYRVLIYSAASVLAYLIVDATRRRWNEYTTAWKRLFLLATCVILLTAPWLYNVGQRFLFPMLSAGGERLTGTSSYNAFPWEFLWIRHNGTLLTLSGLGILWALWKRSRLMLTMPVWVGLVGLAANPNLIGLRPLWLINNATAVISLFLPMGILSGYLLAELAGGVAHLLPDNRQRAAQLLLGLLVVVTGLWGVWDMADVINPVTVLATEDDQIALAWIREHTPPDARFLINARFWQEGTYTGSDGGYWLTVLTGRATTLPMVHYIYGTTKYARLIRDFALQVSALSSVDDPQFLQTLRKKGVTHVYVGAKGGAISSAELVASPHFRPIYHHGAAWVFSFLDAGSSAKGR